MNRKFILIVNGIIAVLLFSTMSEVHAKKTRRAESWEASFLVLNSDATKINGEGDSSLDLDSDIGWGFTLGYNINEHVLVNLEWATGTPDYSATFIGDDSDSNREINHKLTVYHTQINGIYNFSTDQFTPFVQAGLGWSFVDSNIASSPPVGGCWYDPWFGYVCNGYQPTFNDTRFSYNLAAGVRYELDNSVFFKASYQQQWIDLSHSEDATFGLILLEIGSIF